MSLSLATVEADTKLVQQGLTILKNGNWAAALAEFEKEGPRGKIEAGINVGETVVKLVSLAIPQADALEIVLQLMMIAVVNYKRGIDYGDPNYNAPAGNGNPAP